MGEKFGLLFIGRSHYKTPAEFLREGEAMGLSRRITAVPRDFELGKTWVCFAHRDCIEQPCDECDGGKKFELDDPCDECDGAGTVTVPAIFSAFRPTAIEYVVKGDESDEELERKVERGFTLVRVHKIEETGSE